jgi:hypothetical protein
MNGASARSRRGWGLVPLVVVLAAALAGCAGAGLAPSADVTTTVVGWEHYLRLEWAAQPGPAGTDIDGYVHNQYGSPMGGVRLLAQALDGPAVVAQTIVWVPGIVPNFGRSYFRIPTLPPAPAYRVTVWSFDIIETDDFRRRRHHRF